MLFSHLVTGLFVALHVLVTAAVPGIAIRGFGRVVIVAV